MSSSVQYRVHDERDNWNPSLVFGLHCRYLLLWFGRASMRIRLCTGCISSVLTPAGCTRHSSWFSNLTLIKQLLRDYLSTALILITFSQFCPQMETMLAALVTTTALPPARAQEPLFAAVMPSLTRFQKASHPRPQSFTWTLMISPP